MQVAVILKIRTQGHEDLLTLNKVDAGEGRYAFDSPCVPPVGTVLHLPLGAVKRALAQCGIKEESAHSILLNYSFWDVVEHGIWEIDESGRPSAAIACVGRHPYNKDYLLKYDDLFK